MIRENIPPHSVQRFLAFAATLKTLDANQADLLQWLAFYAGNNVSTFSPALISSVLRDLYKLIPQDPSTDYFIKQAVEHLSKIIDQVDARTMQFLLQAFSKFNTKEASKFSLIAANRMLQCLSGPPESEAVSVEITRAFGINFIFYNNSDRALVTTHLLKLIDIVRDRPDLNDNFQYSSP